MRKTCFARLWLSVALTLGLGGIAAAQPNLNLPPGQVMPTVRFSTTMSLPGYFTVQFPGIPNGYDIHNAQTYLAWCAQANGTLLLGAVAPPIYGENTAKFTLYNTYPNSALPAPAQSGNWPQVNYLLNHKNGATVADIQSAIWYLLDGFYDGPYVSNTPPNAATQALLTDAANNGTNFVPQPGQVVAVFLYGNSLGLNTSGGNPQDLVIEVPIPTGATIGDFVWNDSNNDGIQNCGELGINNVTVQLWTGSVGTGTLYATTTTGAAPAGYTNTYKLGCQENGYYQFSGLPPGDYCVAILAGQPALSGLNLVTALQGADTNLDSNGLPGPGGYSANACLTVPANSINESIDFGYSGPQLQVVKTPKSGTFTSGSQVSFTIVVSNPAPAGSQNATNVMLNDALPVNGGLTWVSATTTQGTCSITNNNLSCALGTLTPGQSATVVVSSPTNPPSSACQDQPNAAAIATADGGLTAQDSGFQTCTPVQPPAELAATKSSGSFPFEGQASFTITVSNPAAAGSQPATDVALNDVLPTVGGMTWATATASQGVCTINGGSLLSCSLGTIAPQAAVTIVVSSPATTPANACQLQPNPAAIATASGGLTATASGSLTCTPPPPQLAVTKSSGSFLFTGQASFTITVSNPAVSGSQPATNVALNDVLPTLGGMTWATATASQGGCTISGGNLLSCSLGTIAAQAAVTIVVSSPAMTPADACQLQPNPAAIATASGGLTATASGALTCTPPPPQLAVVKSSGSFPYTGQASFIITVSNPAVAGSQPAMNVALNDVLPTAGGMTWATATASQGSCTISGGNLLSCSLGTIAAQAVVTIVVSSPLTTPSTACQFQPNPAANATAFGGLTATASGSLTCTPPPPPCTIPGVTISNTSWNKFNIPAGTSPSVWVHAHIGTPSGVSTTAKSTVLFTGASLALNSTVYPLPDGLLTFDPAAPSTITTEFNASLNRWETVVNPNHMSNEMFFLGAAIPVTPAIAAGAKATLTFTVVSEDPKLSFPWQWSAAVYSYWPTDWNQAQIQPYHNSYHAGTPLNTTVQQSLIQGPRGGGGSNFTGSWSATGTGSCPVQ